MQNPLQSCASFARSMFYLWFYALFVKLYYIRIMKEKALILIGMRSKKWLAEKLGINHITLERRLNKNDWKVSEEMALMQIFDTEKVNL